MYSVQTGTTVGRLDVVIRGYDVLQYVFAETGKNRLKMVGPWLSRWKMVTFTRSSVQPINATNEKGLSLPSPTLAAILPLLLFLYQSDS